MVSIDMAYVLDTSTPASKVINMDSRYGTIFDRKDEDGNELTSQFTYQMKEAILCPEHLSMICFLQSATIPYSFYNVRENVNNALVIEYDSDTYKLTLPAGNYNALSFMDAFTGIIEASDSLLNSTWTPGLYRLYKKSGSTYAPQTTNPFTPFTVQASFDLQRLRYKLHTTVNTNSMTLQWNDPDTTINDLFGFRESNGAQAIPYSTDGHTFIASDKVIDMNDEIHGLYLRTSLTTDGVLNAETGQFGNILSRIPISCNPGGIIFHVPSNSTHKLQITPPVIKYVRVQLTDDHNRILDLNGMNFQISVQIDFVPRYTPLLGMDKVQRRAKNTPQLEPAQKKSKGNI
eukprot:SAG31_NODE_3425_length_4290_cov_171.943927_4_plen_346_part_00